ncbi:Na+/H+ antiporter subunit E [Roseococcus suduntuyensis]|uniref:Multicomponent Na+:H+ antiporter subunit E n=1 Tax=Roseococcus suduntuyensis TaxID=455361 RepID=A0A840A6T1_9PROT|nr:Na+/H+ antiporter subunit E [Roseococcus suduntuyensis]MBB3897219.1 multicomponent Na+:H+ antiporter subunit E [Roseococcus suduntuyensis]
MTEKAPTPRPWNILAWLWLLVLFLRELVLSAWAVISATLAPNVRARSGVVAVPLRLRSAAGITLLADMVTLTPGTTALHVSEDRSILYVHVMDIESPEAVRASIAQRLERPAMRVLR